MRKLLIFMLLLIVGATAYAQKQQQNLGGTNTVVTAKGGLNVDSAFRGPLDTLASASQWSEAYKAGVKYYKGSDNHWHIVTSGGGSLPLLDTLFNSAYFRGLSLFNFNNRSVSVRSGGFFRMTLMGDSHFEIQRIWERALKFALGQRMWLAGTAYVCPVLNVVGPYNMTATPFGTTGFVDSASIYSMNGKAMWGGSGTTSLTYAMVPSSSSPYGDANFTQIKVFYYRQTGGGTFTLTDPNGTPHVKSTAGAAGLDSLIISGITVNGTQSFTYAVTTPSTAGVLLFGFELTSPGVAGALVDRLGHSGWKASDFTHLDSAMWVTQARELNSDTWAWNLGTNDGFAQVDTLLFYRQMDTLITRTRAALPNVDIILLGQLQPSVNGRGAVSISSYNNTLLRLARARGCAFFNDSLVLGNFATNIRNGDINVPTDSIHETATAGTKLAEALINQIPSLSYMPSLPIFNRGMTVYQSYSPTDAVSILSTLPAIGGVPLNVITALGSNSYSIGSTASPGSLTFRDTTKWRAGGNIVWQMLPSGTYLNIDNSSGNKQTKFSFENSAFANIYQGGIGIQTNQITGGYIPSIYFGNNGGRTAIVVGKAANRVAQLDLSNEGDGPGYEWNAYFRHNSTNGAYAGTPMVWNVERFYNGTTGNFFGASDAFQFNVNGFAQQKWQFETGNFTGNSSQILDYAMSTFDIGGYGLHERLRLKGYNGKLLIGDSAERSAVSGVKLELAGKAVYTSHPSFTGATGADSTTIPDIKYVDSKVDTTVLYSSNYMAAGTGLDATSHLQSMLNDASAKGKNVVITGAYVDSSELDMPTTGSLSVSIKFLSGAKITYTPKTGAVMKWNGAAFHDIVIDNPQIYCVNDTTSIGNVGLFFQGVTRSQNIHRVRILGGTISGASTALLCKGLQEFEVAGVNFLSPNGHDVNTTTAPTTFIRAVDDSVGDENKLGNIHDCIFDGFSHQGSVLVTSLKTGGRIDGAYYGHVSGLNFHDNTVKHCDQEEVLYQPAIAFIDSLPSTINHNILDCAILPGSKAQGVNITGVTGIRAEGQNLSITNNKIYHSTTGILFYATSAWNYVFHGPVAQGNIIWVSQDASSNPIKGIHFQGFSSTVRSKGGTIKDNTVKLDSVVLTATFNAITMNFFDSSTVSGNEVQESRVTKTGGGVIALSFNTDTAVTVNYNNIARVDTAISSLSSKLDSGVTVTPAVYSQIASSATNSNSTTPLSMFGTGTGAPLIPANSLSVGQVITLHGFAQMSTAASSPGSMTFNPTIGGTGFSLTFNPAVSLSSQALEVTVTFTVLSTGASGSVFPTMVVFPHGSSSPISVVYSSAITINTTAALAIDLTSQWSTASVSNSIQSLPFLQLKVQ